VPLTVGMGQSNSDPTLCDDTMGPALLDAVAGSGSPLATPCCKIDTPDMSLMEDCKPLEVSVVTAPVTIVPESIAVSPVDIGAPFPLKVDVDTDVDTDVDVNKVAAILLEGQLNSVAIALPVLALVTPC
jgi:hypothetical protein